MYEGKTLVPILCMHRSGSSLTTNVLFELGMSLGPFTAILGAPANPHGHFESREFYILNQVVQDHAFGFADDMPESPETLQRFVESGGRWPDGVDLPPSWLDQGEDLVRRLVASGTVSGFKDPRVPLVWPFWVEVFRRFPGLCVIPVVLLRSPQEIAMSIFMRSQGRFDYCDALDVTAAHFQRIGAIQADWPGSLARVRFLPEYFVEDLSATSRLLGLGWSEEVYSRVFDVECKHHEAAAVAHPAQTIFEQLAALPAQKFTQENAARIATDALLRERLVRRNQVDASQRLQRTEVALASTQAAMASTQAALAAAEARAGRLAADLHMTKASRFWRLRELLVTLPGLKRLANRPLPATTSVENRHAEG
ncbi:MAG: hypothetical protein WCJ35_08760 [Planctomycetota bacterium]